MPQLPLPVPAEGVDVAGVAQRQRVPVPRCYLQGRLAVEVEGQAARAVRVQSGGAGELVELVGAPRVQRHLRQAGRSSFVCNTCREIGIQLQ